MIEFPPLEELRRRQSSKWRRFPADVLPMPVAEMDVRLAPVVARTLHDAIDRGDTGYPGNDGSPQEAFVGFAERRWGWQVSTKGVRSVVDVSVGAVEVLRSALEPGDRVVVNSPVYPPFFMWPGDAALDLVDVPLRPDDDGNGWRLDLPAIEAAFAAGARAHLLCHPHNPLGHLHPREDLVALADLADRYGVLVVADEIHAPLALPGNQFVPFLSVSDVAARVGVALHSASKAWNLAGLKFAFIITVHEEAAERLRKLPLELAWLTGHLGAMATATAYSQGEAWLDELLPVLADNQRRFAELLGEHLPEAVYRRGKAGYLAWVDTRALGWGDEPAATTLRHGRLALGIGSHFGDTGKGHVRVNLGCSPELVPEAVRRLVRTAELMSQERKS